MMPTTPLLTRSRCVATSAAGALWIHGPMIVRARRLAISRGIDIALFLLVQVISDARLNRCVVDSAPLQLRRQPAIGVATMRSRTVASPLAIWSGQDNLAIPRPPTPLAVHAPRTTRVARRNRLHVVRACGGPENLLNGEYHG